MKKIQKGFTLIELMIVVAIIGILAAVAIPAYQDYIVKSKLSKVVTTLDPIKTALALYLQEQGGFPVAVAGDMVGGAAGNASGTPTTPATFWASLGFSVFPSLPAEVYSLAPFTATAGGATSSTNMTLILELQNIKAGTINGTWLSISPNTKDNLQITSTNNPSPSSATVADTPAGATVAGASALQWYYGCAKAGDAALGYNAANPDAVLTNFFKNNNVPIICR